VSWQREDRAAGAIFAALADANRRRIIRSVAARDSATATELAGSLAITRQAVTKHLAALSEAGLVASERRGREVRYRLTPRPMTDAAGWMADIGAEWDERLDALRQHLASRGPAD
jgi:DNA-binding transcriptional ArsR family regulator